MSLWTRFYNKLQEKRILPTYYPAHYSYFWNMTRIYVSSLDGRIEGCRLFNVSNFLDDVVQVYEANWSKTGTVEGAVEASELIRKVTDNGYERYLQMSQNPTPVQKLCLNIFDDIDRQEDPRNRTVTKLYFELQHFYYKVYVDSNCDEWACDEHKFIGYCLEDNKDYLNMQFELGGPNSLTEQQVKIRMSSDVIILSAGMKYLDKHCETEQGDDGYLYFKSEDPASKQVEGFACLALINKDGSCNYKEMDKLRSLGYDVFPGEKDSFGWLTGCIRSKETNAVVVYG